MGDIDFLKPLDSSTEAQLTAAAPHLHLEAFLPEFKTYVQKCNNIGASLMIKDTILGAMLDVEDVELEDCPWFVDHFPGDIPMSCVTETYRLLDRLHKA